MMGKSVWYNPFSWGEREASIMTKKVEDTTKTAVSGPLSSYLSSNIGKGLPRYTGALYEPFDADAYSRYKEFLSMDPGKWFDKAVAEPETARFKSELLPELREGYAGGLRGSGRYFSEEEAMNKFSTALSQERYQAMRDIPKEQFTMASEYKKMRDQERMLEYQDWFKSLPENNPILGKALEFLNANTGIDFLSATDPGQKGWFADLLATVIKSSAAAAA